MQEFLKKEYLGSFIDNQFLGNSKITPISLKSCVTKKIWKKLYPATDTQIDKAIRSSYKTFSSFRKTTAYERSIILKKMSSLLLEHKKEIARIMTTEMGKTLKESEDEITYARGYFDWFSYEALRTLGYEIPSQNKQKRIFVSYEPLGVCAIITPWNFPIAMAARKISTAIAAGCTVIIKPSPETPVTMLCLAELFRQTHLPQGAMQVLVGEEKKLGQKLLDAPEIQKISFTGSTHVGKYLYERCAKTMKKATLELGGNAPLIVFDDADISLAVQESIKAKFRNHGQSCVAANRIFIQKPILEKFIQKFLKAMKMLNIGNPFLEDVDLTNVLHPESKRKMKRHIEDAVNKGAKHLLKGKTLIHPNILTQCTAEMLVFHEETFSPLAAIYEFTEDAEAITLANATPYGLAAYLFTTDIRRANNACKMLHFGMIGLNDGVFSTHQIPFGGVKSSGFGREGGPYGIYEYLVEKAVSVRL